MARLKGDQAAVAAVRDRLLEFGRTNSNKPIGVRSIVFAGDISATIQELDSALVYYSEAQKLLKQIPDSQQTFEYGLFDYGPYIRIRIGDALFNQRKPEKAVSTWSQTFREYPNTTFALQIPQKVIYGNERSSGGEEGWKLSRAFFEDVRVLVTNKKHRGRVDVEYLLLLNKGASESYMDVAEYLAIMESTLDSYEIGENELIERARDNLLNLKKELLKKYPLKR